MSSSTYFSVDGDTQCGIEREVMRNHAKKYLFWFS